jgi:hypothetical protein
MSPQAVEQVKLFLTPSFEGSNNSIKGEHDTTVQP